MEKCSLCENENENENRIDNEIDKAPKKDEITDKIISDMGKRIKKSVNREMKILKKCGISI